MSIALAGNRMHTPHFIWFLFCTCILMVGCSWHRRQELADIVPLHANEWSQYGGEWQFKAYEIENESSGRGDKIVYRTREFSNFDLEADIKVSGPFAETGILFRSKDEETGVDSFRGYFAGIRSIDRSIELQRVDYGRTVIAEVPLAANLDLQKPIHLHFQARGCVFSLVATTSDGRQVKIRHNEERCVHSGHLGFRSSSASVVWSKITFRDVGISEAVENDSQMSSPEQPLPRLSDAPLLRDASQYIEDIRQEVVKHAPPEGVQPISFFVLKHGTYHNVTLLGTVISTPPFMVIDDGTASLVLPDSGIGSKINPGDEVEVKGTIISQGFTVSMEDSHIRVLWSDPPVPPLAVSALQLTNGQYRARSIAIQGVLLSNHFTSDGCELILRDQSQLYRAVVAAGAMARSACFIELGSRLRLRGVATSIGKWTKNIYPFAVIVSGLDVLASPPWWSLRHIAMLIAVLILCGMFLQWAIYSFQQWHLQSVLVEREEIAFDMHDTLAQSFTGIAYQLEAATMEPDGLEATREHLRNALQTVKLSHREASNTIAALRPQNRDANSILNTLRGIAERISRGGNVRITTELIGTSIALPVQITDAIFRIGQEAITNSLRHSRCNNLRIIIRFTTKDVCFCVQDDGEGFHVEQARRGLGIAGMCARAKKLGATLKINAIAPTGTVVEVTSPLPIAGGFFINLRRILRFMRSMLFPHKASSGKDFKDGVI